ncbi:MAG: Mut7-C RNAse domain-containing protein [Candidatus Omnitrophica bacterium]|nr:Mut7-C RNAse domain-containing protein [Candidatus Omnitrophota bacterium]
MKFITTKELGRLAKWLRIMGFDTEYFPEKERRELVIKSLRENRIILTRDSKMSVYSGVRMVHIKSDFVQEQVRQVVRELDMKIDRKRFFSLCVICNKQLTMVEKEDVKLRVPDYVYRTQEHFMKCAACDRIYWQGTHWTNVGDFVDRIGLEKDGG